MFRNLSDGWKWELAQTKKELLAEKGKVVKRDAGKAAREKHLRELSESDKTLEDKDPEQTHVTRQ